MRSIFIIRFHYDENDPRFGWRFAYFRAMVLPRILAQTHHDFEIGIRCNPAHDKLFADLSPKIRVFHVKDEFAAYKKDRYFYDFVPWDRVIDLPRYELQLGLDSDDLIREDYLETFVRNIENMAVSHAGSIHLCFQPEIFDTKTLKIFPIKQRYSPEKGSAFFALYQPKEWEPYRFAYEVSHLKMHTIALWSIAIDEPGICFASTHELNESTRV